MTTRRKVLRGAVAMGIAAGCNWRVIAAESIAGQHWFDARRLPIGLQLYTLGDAMVKDLDATLAKVASIGFHTLELAGYHGHTPQELRAAADAHGLRYTSIHIGATAQRGNPGLDQDLPRLAADLHVLGVTDVVMPMFPFPERLGAARPGEAFPAYMQRIAAQFSADDWQRTAALLNDLGGKLRAEGLRLGYHNHNPEFAPVAGTTGMELLLTHTARENVAFELDVGWVAAAGVDPAALLKRHPQRFQLMHLKDIKATTKTNFAMQQDPCEVGAGSLDWNRILPAAYEAGVRKFYVEQEPPFAEDRLVAVGKSYRFLKAFELGGVLRL